MPPLTVHAPEFADDLRWLNTTRPLSMRELRGQLVILDFWTYCCVNCMHVIPTLRRIEEKHATDPLVVIGVHSAKFDGEKDAARIDEAIQRYEVHHPVVVDRDMTTWQAFAVRSWPTLVIVRPDGTIAAVAPGEPDFGVLDRFIDEELALARKKGTLATKPFEVHAAPREHDGPLAYPGKVAVGPGGGSIAVSDSGHHRVLVLDESGHVTACAGSGRAGHADGALQAAAFDDPQGIAWRSPTQLYVADARTHTVRRIDLARGLVITVAGTGHLGESPLKAGTHSARETALRSPWDLALDGDQLFVALAGSHQIAVLDLSADTIELVAGTGAESIIDGALALATFSQPSGLALWRGKRGDEAPLLYVADSETSAVRVVELEGRRVRTIVGTGLFDFGDRDGPRELARLQHDVGLAMDPDGGLVVADTYNHKLRHVDRTTGRVTTLAADFAEPSGLAWEPARRGWVVADTNHHRLVRVDASGAERTTIEVQGAPPVQKGRVAIAPRETASADAEWFTARLATNGDAALAPGDGAVVFPLHAPSGRKFAKRSPMAITVEVSRRSDLIRPLVAESRIDADGGASQSIVILVTVMPFAEVSILAEMIVRIDAVVCDETAGEGTACVPHRNWVRLPVRLAPSGGARVEFERD